MDKRYIAARLANKEQLMLYMKIPKMSGFSRERLECKEKNNTVVEFAVRTVDKAMGVATYRTTREMPAEMQGILPDTGKLARLL